MRHRLKGKFWLTKSSNEMPVVIVQVKRRHHHDEARAPQAGYAPIIPSDQPDKAVLQYVREHQAACEDHEAEIMARPTSTPRSAAHDPRCYCALFIGSSKDRSIDDQFALCRDLCARGIAVISTFAIARNFPQPPLTAPAFKPAGSRADCLMSLSPKTWIASSGSG